MKPQYLDMFASFQYWKGGQKYSALFFLLSIMSSLYYVFKLLVLIM